jgi:hypothetical protein
VNSRHWYFPANPEKNCIIRHKTASINNDLPEISKMKYRNRIPDSGTTISGCADNINKKKKKKKIPTDRP